MAAPIPEQSVDDVRNRSDIVEIVGEHVSLKKRGRDFWACCPFHREKTPSFKVSAEHQTFYCFGCGKSGNVFSFVMEFENLDFPSTVRMLAQRAGVIIPESSGEDRERAAHRRSRREQLLDVLRDASRWYAKLLHSETGAPARRYLASRGIPEDVVSEFALGYAQDAWDAVEQWGARRNYSVEVLQAAGLLSHNEEKDRRYDRFRGRLMFPIHDHLGHVVGFSGRVLDSEAKTAKYVNTPETEVFRKSRLLYGLHRARRAFRDHGFALVCEGQLDVIACHRAGLLNGVAPQGTAFTPEQARMLKRFCSRVVFAFDADAAGQKAARRSVVVAFETGLDAGAIRMSEGDDPDSILRHRGADALAELAQRATDGFEFLLDAALREHPDGTPSNKAAIVDDLLPALAALDNPVRASAQCSWLAERLHLPESSIRQSLERHSRRSESRRASGAEKTRAEEAPRKQAMPLKRRAAPTGKIGAEVVLLDLALRHGAIAHELCETLPPETLSDSPVGRSINLVLAHTHQGEWADAAHHVSADRELSEDPDVGRVLAKTAFPAPESGEETSRDREKSQALLHRAMTDALAALERFAIRDRMREIQQRLRDETAPDAAHSLTEEYQNLARRFNRVQP